MQDHFQNSVLIGNSFRDLMGNHHKYFHKGDRRYLARKSDYDVMQFMCRVCNWREDSLEEVKEHAKTHSEHIYTRSYRERQVNRFRSDVDRSRSPRRQKTR